MKVESIAECSLGAFCNTFDLHKAIIGLENQFSVFFRVAVLHRFYCNPCNLSQMFYKLIKFSDYFDFIVVRAIDVLLYLPYNIVSLTFRKRFPKITSDFFPVATQSNRVSRKCYIVVKSSTPLV